MTIIRQLLKVKGHGCFSVGPGENVYSAIKKMAEKDVSSVLVTDGATQHCMALMTEKRVRHLPVVEHEAVVGIISIGDLVKSVIDDQRFTIHQLETYFSGDLNMH